MIDRLKITKTITITYEHIPLGDSVDLIRYMQVERNTSKYDIINTLKFVPDTDVKIEVEFEDIYDIEE